MENQVLNNRQFSDEDLRKIVAWNKLFGGLQTDAPGTTTAKANSSNVTGELETDTMEGSSTLLNAVTVAGTRAIPVDQPICAKMANECIDEYQAKFDPTTATYDPGIMKDAYTWSMRFGSINLRDWLEDICNHTNIQEMQIRLGIYTGSILTQFPTQIGPNKGRITAFFYPVDANGDLAKYTTPSNYMPPSGTLDCSNLLRTAPALQDDDVTVYDFAGIEP